MKRDTKALSQHSFDVLIIGAGIYGAATAWDAALRGLSVALIDKSDFGSATSSNSLKIVHGGLRYLQQLDIPRVRESVRERMIFMRIAPHLVHPFPCVMPTYGHFMKGNEIMRMGLYLNDILSFDRNRLQDPEKSISAGRVVSRKECLRLVPGIDGKRVRGGAFWTDAQMYNSERLLLSFVLSASRRGAEVANYIEAKEFLKRGNRVEGVKAVDGLTGDALEIRATMIINTSGGWVDEVLRRALKHSSRVHLSTAMNLVVRRSLLSECAAGIAAPFRFQRNNGSVYQGSRVLFFAPWRKCTLIGTYHQPYSGNPEDLQVTEKEIQDFLENVNAGYPQDPIGRDEISFVHKGFLPMDGIHRKTGEILLTKHSRLYDHFREDGLDGLISVVGVKYTTARDVAEKAVNRIFKKMGKTPPSPLSRDTQLVGGEIERFDDFLSRAVSSTPEGQSAEVVRHLVYNYGSEYARILKYGERRSDLLKTVPGSSEVLLAEVIHAIREEMAQKLTDIVLRRTDLGSAGHPGKEAIATCVRVAAKELGWNKSRTQEEVDDLEKTYEAHGLK